MKTTIQLREGEQMNEWKINTPGGEQTVKAWSATVTASGDLLLRDQHGESVHLFASGAWTECVRVKDAPRGYGG